MPTKKKTLETLVDVAPSTVEDQSTPLETSSAPSVAIQAKQTDVAPDSTTPLQETHAMELLLSQYPVTVPGIGDVIEGTVLDITSNSILLDLGPLGTGIVLGKEMRDGMEIEKLKVGAVVQATLTELENDEGFIELSIRAASYEKSWEDLEMKRDNKEAVATKVKEANKGGLIIEINGISGFLPVSQLASEHYPRVEDGDKNKILELLRRLVGQELSVRIIDADRAGEKLIVSEKAAQSEKERALIGSLKVGDTIEGEISGVVDFGAFVKFPAPDALHGEKLEGLVHISELAWQLIDDPRTIVKTGDAIEAKIIGLEDTRISLSMKALKADPWTTVEEKYKVGEKVDGTVDKINHFGAFVYLNKDIHGLAHVSEFQDVYPGKKMEEIFKQGETHKWKILSIEPKTHRMGLLPVK